MSGTHRACLLCRFWTIVLLATLLAQLWFSCFMAKMYSEKIQDRENDASDKVCAGVGGWNGWSPDKSEILRIPSVPHLQALVDFVWHRRRELWVQLERFEDVVQRQFEELRVSLVHRQAQGPRGLPGAPSGSLGAR